ncbi:oligosaccharide flippase family protein [Rhizobium sp. LjRoot254]|uniref:oligosaccharide flippase family protein n=1 Tax=Rhizobium sp. LjRoot254 TaxID=3342297 RepID=UPI003ECDD458
MLLPNLSRENYSTTKTLLTRARRRITTSMKMRFFTDVGLILFVQLFAKLINFIYIIYLARYVGAEDFGYLNLVLSVIIIFDAVGDIGMTRFMLREASIDIERGRAFAAALLPFRLSLAAAANALVMLFFWTFDFQSIVLQLVAVIAFSLYFTALASFLEALLQSRSHFSNISFAHLCLALVQVGTGAVVIAMKGDILVIAVTFVISNIVYAGILYRGVCQLGIVVWPRRDLAVVLSAIPKAAPYALIFCLFIVSSRIELIMLGWFHSGQGLGLYSIAARMMDAAAVAPLAVGTVLSPRFIQLHDNRHSELADLYAWVFRIVLVLSVLGAILGTELGAPIMTFLLSRSFAGVDDLILILFAVYPFAAIYYLNLALLLGAGEQRPTVVLVMLLVGIQILCSLMIIPPLGAEGAALAFGLSMVIAAVVSTIFVYWKYVRKADLLYASFPAVVAVLPTAWLVFRNGREIDIERDIAGILLYCAISLLLTWRFKLRIPT